eukprot:3634798-Amphidinium_carterae.1
MSRARDKKNRNAKRRERKGLTIVDENVSGHPKMGKVDRTIESRGIDTSVERTKCQSSVNDGHQQYQIGTKDPGEEI